MPAVPSLPPLAVEQLAQYAVPWFRLIERGRHPGEARARLLRYLARRDRAKAAKAAAQRIEAERAIEQARALPAGEFRPAMLDGVPFGSALANVEAKTQESFAKVAEAVKPLNEYMREAGERILAVLDIIRAAKAAAHSTQSSHLAEQSADSAGKLQSAGLHRPASAPFPPPAPPAFHLPSSPTRGPNL